jgi:hypothetical protein
MEYADDITWLLLPITSHCVHLLVNLAECVYLNYWLLCWAFSRP